ncbi:MAG TPA: ClpXP protease specificity-enhancing factor SspB [Myxococcales bacterium]|jgi:stringent starvation protein B|nr:ClpXP protease specificity-enhancing factor SspB [Myxococcales bacterium]
MSVRSPEKKQTLLAFLSRGVAMVHLDARQAGVSVPEHLKSDPHLRLNFSYRYGLPDFDIGDDTITATLSFGGRPFYCVLPWDAVFAVTSSGTAEGQVWPEDLPTDAARAFEAEQPKPRPQLVAVGEEKGRSSRRNRAAEPAQQQRPSPDDPPEGPKPGGHLRLVR